MGERNYISPLIRILFEFLREK